MKYRSILVTSKVGLEAKEGTSDIGRRHCEQMNLIIFTGSTSRTEYHSVYLRYMNQ